MIWEFIWFFIRNKSNKNIFINSVSFTINEVCSRSQMRSNFCLFESRHFTPYVSVLISVKTSFYYWLIWSFIISRPYRMGLTSVTPKSIDFWRKVMIFYIDWRVLDWCCLCLKKEVSDDLDFSPLRANKSSPLLSFSI